MSVRELPSIDKILTAPQIRKLTDMYSRDWVTSVARECVQHARASVGTGMRTPSIEQLADLVVKKANLTIQMYPSPAINATGVIIHTNLGRAPLSSDASETVTRTSEGYSILEMNLGDGARGSRQTYVENLLQYLINCESTLVVNNNASAMLLSLSAVARDKTILVSRGESVEIGGGFRIPDVLAQSGATLVEVGTTNRTYLRDYELAVTDHTAAILKVHSSNFRIEGFTHSVEISELAGLAKKFNIPLIHDIGSGCLVDTTKFGLPYEPRPQDSLKDGSSLVCFSGDKLLGGPQSGIIAGEKRLIDNIKTEPLSRTLRIGKLDLAALGSTLVTYIRGQELEEIPIWKMIATPKDHLRKRANRLKNVIVGKVSVVDRPSTIGGGSLPGCKLDSWVLAISCDGIKGGAQGLMQRLREQKTPIIARIEQGMVLLDLRTVFEREEVALIEGLNKALV